MRKVIIIAEAGVNHNGDLERAKELIKVAANAGADFVKFQTFKADKIVSKVAKKASYQSKNINDGDNSQYNMLKKLEIPDAWYPELLVLCKKENIEFLSTGFDNESIDFLNDLPIELFKIPSGELTNKSYLQHIAKKKKPVVLSTGMADIREINDAVEVLIDAGLDKSNLAVLHCNTEYPTPMEDVNLKAMLHIQNEIGVEVGYSDHTLGIEVPIAAVALGAKVIEKHFTLDRNLPGPDHKASLEPDELVAMVKAIRNIEMAISGNGIKAPSKSEIPNKVVARKSIHTLNVLGKGHTLQESDLIMRRPGDGISPMDIDQIVGRKLKSDLAADVKLSLEHLA
ncbi:N-acetylneuraminate synthase [Marivirga harenae]|uniref:N-acetylneuraminate synthase n=1 Tax=Marivirga harenae TaxID=2010992 RepID=UPI0026E00C00|nr:N-acetylneuraminate synthase [Marivirga harenae]WKV11361.1 N-acetylneuraminate synthase [Marivirga harenae]